MICDWNTAMIEPNSDVKQPIEQIVVDWIINQNWTIKKEEFYNVYLDLV